MIIVGQRELREMRERQESERRVEAVLSMPHVVQLDLVGGWVGSEPMRLRHLTPSYHCTTVSAPASYALLRLPVMCMLLRLLLLLATAAAHPGCANLLQFH